MDEAYDVADNIHEDDIDDGISIETNFDADNDMTINPFLASGLDYSYVDLDEEYDQLHWIVWGMP